MAKAGRATADWFMVTLVNLKPSVPSMVFSARNVATECGAFTVTLISMTLVRLLNDDKRNGSSALPSTATA